MRGQWRIAGELTSRWVRYAALPGAKPIRTCSELPSTAFKTSSAAQRSPSRTFTSSALACDDSSRKSQLEDSSTPSFSTSSSSSTAAYLLEQALKLEEEEERILEAQKRRRKPKELQEDAWDGDEPQHRAIRRILEDQYKPLRVKVSCCLAFPRPSILPTPTPFCSVPGSRQADSTASSPSQFPVRRPSPSLTVLRRALNAERAVASQVQGSRALSIRHPYLRLFISSTSHIWQAFLLAEVKRRRSASAAGSSMGAIARLRRRLPTRRSRREGDGTGRERGRR